MTAGNARPRGAPPGSGYGDQRAYLVAESLAVLRGPTAGVVELDGRLDWSGNPIYDLDKAGNLLALYQVVLNESTELTQLHRWLDENTLRRLWPELWLPPRLRRAWELRFPELTTTRRMAG